MGKTSNGNYDCTGLKVRRQTAALLGQSDAEKESCKGLAVGAAPGATGVSPCDRELACIFRVARPQNERVKSVESNINTSTKHQAPPPIQTLLLLDTGNFPPASIQENKD